MSPNATAERVDPAASFERRSAVLRESWTPEIRDFAASLAAEIDFARRLREFRPDKAAPKIAWPSLT